MKLITFPGPTYLDLVSSILRSIVLSKLKSKQSSIKQALNPYLLFHKKSTDTMGLFSPSSSASLPPPKIGADGAPIAPDRTQRSKCWEARDAYFECLDRAKIIDSITEKDRAETACAVEGRGFESNCATSWVSFLDREPEINRGFV